MRPHLAIQSHEILPGIRSQGLARPALKEVSDWLSLQRGAFSIHLGPSSVHPLGPRRTLEIANHSFYLLLSRRYRLFHCDTCAFLLFLTQPFPPPLSPLHTLSSLPPNQVPPSVRHRRVVTHIVQMLPHHGGYIPPAAPFQVPHIHLHAQLVSQDVSCHGARGDNSYYACVTGTAAASCGL